MQLISSFLSLLAVAAAAPASDIDSRAISDKPFQLYAYGPGIGGLTVFSTGGNVYIGNHSNFTDPEAAPIVFTASTEKVWTGAPNNTGFANGTAAPSWADLIFSIPTATSPNRDVTLLNSRSTPDRQTEGFFLFGSFAFFSGADNKVDAAWYAQQDETSGFYSLKWNVTDENAEGTRILLKSTPPSTFKMTF